MDQSISHFWDNYISKSKAYGVKPHILKWYVHHAEAYIKAHKHVHLVAHTPEIVEQYLKEKGRNTRLQDWQFKQNIDALKILFVEVMGLPWAKSFAWDDWADAAKQLPDSHPTIARENDTSHEFDKNAFTLDTYKALPGGLIKKVFTKYPEHLNNLVHRIRIKHYSIRTEQSYLAWLVRFIQFHNMKDPAELLGVDIGRYLDHLVIQRNVASSTQQQALNALIFFFKQVLEKNVDDIGPYRHSTKPKRLPVVLTRDEVNTIFSNIQSPVRLLMANLLYGCGMRLMECLRLRIQDIDFGYQQIFIRNAKGKKIGLSLCPLD